MLSRISARGVATVAVAMLLLTIPNAFAQTKTEAGQPWGSWYWLTDISAFTGFPGTTSPTLLGINQDGSFTCAEGTMFGGYIGATETYTPGMGTWKKTGGGIFHASRLMLVFDKTTGVLTGILRSRFSFHFVGSFNRIEGKLWLEVLSCSDPFGCPDPLDPGAGWTPLSPPEGLPGWATRIPVLPVGPLQ